jgi:hypothetical protein
MLIAFARVLSGLGEKKTGNMLQQKGGLLFCPPFRRKNATEEKAKPCRSN